MDYISDELKALISIIAALFVFVWLAIHSCYSVENVHLKVFVDEKLVYDGRSACVDVESAGYATSVNVRGGWYCLFPKEKYTAKNVFVETV